VFQAAAARLGLLALPLLCSSLACFGADRSKVTIMTRNVDAGTDMGYIFAGTDEASYAKGLAATWAELQSSHFQERARAFAEEVEATQPDLIALQEVTLWRTGPMMQPPATEVLYDQLDLILTELGKRHLNYGVVAVQTELDAEAPVPTKRLDLRMTDRDVILANLDAPQSAFDLVNAQTHRYNATFAFGNPILGQLAVPCGWMAVDVTVNGSRFRFVNTHLQSTVAGVPEATNTQLAQVDELLAAIASAGMPVVIAGDFNSNAEPGPESTGAVLRIVGQGFADTWKAIHPRDAGYTWPLFGEDQNPDGRPNERIDLIFASTGLTPTAATLVGTRKPLASDHAGVVVKLRLP
jgi:endonuclease/exonuclease/phosphatase family metal-dependent hydrolase